MISRTPSYAQPATVLVALLVSAMPATALAESSPDSGHRALPLDVQTTEEGQRVVFDAYTWQRRELAKRLPLSEPWPEEDEIAGVIEQYDLDESPVPEFIPTPSRILTDVYLVGSVPNHTWLVDGGSAGLVLIDPGLVTNFETVMANVEQLGYSREDIRWILNTHAHFDHSMASGLAQRLGAEIMIGAADAAAIERGTRVTANFMLPPGTLATYPTTKVDRRLADGEELHLGNKTFHVIHTPGHTAGSTCYLLQVEDRNILFSGDTILYDHRLGQQNTAYADDRDYVRSLEKLANFSLTLKRLEPLRWDVLLAGHGTLVLDRAWLDLEKGWRTVQIDLLEGDPVDALPFSTERYRKLMFGRP